MLTLGKRWKASRNSDGDQNTRSKTKSPPKSGLFCLSIAAGRVWSAVEGLDFLHCQLVFFFESDEVFEEFSDVPLYGLAGDLAIRLDKVLIEPDGGPADLFDGGVG